MSLPQVEFQDGSMIATDEPASEAASEEFEDALYRASSTLDEMAARARRERREGRTVPFPA